MTADSTLDDVRRADEGPGSRWGRRIGLVVLLLVVVAGALGVFGVHSATTSVDRDGYHLAVTYPRTARAGLDVPFRIDVHHAGGFDAPFTLAVSSDWFRMFETQGFFPDAASSSNDGHFVSFKFMPPAGEDFLLEYDAYIQPSAQIGKSATIKLITHGTTVARVHIHTWLAP